MRSAGLFHRSRVTGHGSRVTGHRSRVTGHGSRVTGHGSRVTGHGSQVTGHGSQVTGHGSRVTGHGSRFTGHGSRVAGHRFMSTSTPVMWSLSLQQGMFRVYIFSVGSQALPPCGYCWRRSRVRVASKLLVFWGEINTNGHTVKCLA